MSGLISIRENWIASSSRNLLQSRTFVVHSHQRHLKIDVNHFLGEGRRNTQAALTTPDMVFGHDILNALNCLDTARPLKCNVGEIFGYYSKGLYLRILRFALYISGKMLWSRNKWPYRIPTLSFVGALNVRDNTGLSAMPSSICRTSCLQAPRRANRIEHPNMSSGFGLNGGEFIIPCEAPMRPAEVLNTVQLLTIFGKALHDAFPSGKRS